MTVVLPQDPDVLFLAYAIASIAGELRRYLRDTSWRIHVARTLKKGRTEWCRPVMRRPSTWDAHRLCRTPA